MNYAPHPYQINAIQTMCANPSAALFLDPGLGKTSITLAAFTMLKEAGAVKSMLVIAPIRPMNLVWPNEIAKWADFNGLTFSIVNGTPKQREAALDVKADIYLINPENIAWLAQQNVPAGLPDMLVVDESTRFKNPASVRFKALKLILDKFSRRYILTGTPAPQSVQDLFAQSYILDGGARLGRFITHFRKQFCNPELIYIAGGRTITKWNPKPEAAELIYKMLNGIALRLRAEDYLTMPALTMNTVEVELPAAARVAYKAMERDLFTTLGNGTNLTAASAAAAVMKLRQIVNGWAYSEEGSELVHEAKLEALAELVEEQQGQPTLVAVSFLHEVQAIRDTLGDQSIPYLGGGVSAKEADTIVARWNRGELPVLLAHPTSVAHGLNLQAGGHAVCWFGLTWALEEHEQFNCRVYRQGQKRPVVIHYIIVKDSVDESILAALKSKSSAQSAILERLKAKK